MAFLVYGLAQAQVRPKTCQAQIADTKPRPSGIIKHHLLADVSPPPKPMLNRPQLSSTIEVGSGADIILVKKAKAAGEYCL